MPSPDHDPIAAARAELAAPGVQPAGTGAPGERPGDVLAGEQLPQRLGEGGMDAREVMPRFEAERRWTSPPGEGSVSGS